MYVFVVVDRDRSENPLTCHPRQVLSGDLTGSHYDKIKERSCGHQLPLEIYSW